MLRNAEMSVLATLFGFVVVVATAPFVSASATPGQIHEVKRGTVNLRAGPGTDAKVMRTLEAGARLMEFARKGRWYRVKEMGRVGPEGWVRGDLIAPEVLPEPVPQPAPEVAGRPPEEGQPAPDVEDDDGRYTVYPGLATGRRNVRNRAFVPWGGTVKRKKRGRKKHGARGGHNKKRVLRSPAPRGTSRNLGWPRSGGVPNIGSF